MYNDIKSGTRLVCKECLASWFVIGLIIFYNILINTNDLLLIKYNFSLLLCNSNIM